MAFFNKDKIQELYPEAVMYPAMKIHASTNEQLLKACNSNEYFAQLKKDGYWYQLEKHTNTYLFSRAASRTTGLQTEKSANVPHIIDAVECLPKDTILIGEIYYPGGSSKNTTEIMGCSPAKAIERQNGAKGKIHYYIHDILMYDGVDLVAEKVNNETRYEILKRVFQKFDLYKYDFLELAEVWYDNLYERVGNALAAGEEGMVLKKKDGIYEPDKRPMTNLKAKKVDFIDAIIIGFESPTKEYYGQELETWGYNILCDEEETRLQGSYLELCEIFPKNNIIAVTKPYYYHWDKARIKIGAYDSNGDLKEIGVIHSGISDAMKEDMSESPTNYLNKVCSIQCMELDKKAKTIRHGFFKYLREDKSPDDCLIEEIFK